MTTKQKCEKLAAVLETVAAKLRDSEIGEKVWEAEEPTMQTLVSQVHIFLKRAITLSATDTKSLKFKSKKSKNSAKEKDTDDAILNDWPEIIQ